MCTTKPLTTLLDHNVDYVKEKTMNIETVVEMIWDSIEGLAPDPEPSNINTFEEKGVLTTDKGLVLTFPDGSEFQVTVVQRK